MHQVLVLNNVSQTGLDQFNKAYRVGSDISDPTAIVLRSAKLDTDLYPYLLAVARAGAGVNTITVDKATAKGICVFNTPGANANAVAELVYFMLGTAARHIDKSVVCARSFTGDDADISVQSEAVKSRFTGFELRGKTIGVIGLGKIGVLVANLGIAFGMNVIGYDQGSTPGNMHQLSSRVKVVRNMAEVLAVADMLTVHVPISDTNKHLIGAAQIALMKNGSVLANFARDGIYDNDAVIAAQAAGKVRSYITDFPTRKLLPLEWVIPTPHQGASTDESEENCAVMAVQQLKNYLEFGVVENSVNFPTMEMYPERGVRTRLAIVHRNIPGMLNQITGVIASAELNITAQLNKGRDTIASTLIDLADEVGEGHIEAIRRSPDVLRVRALRFPI